MSQIKEDTIGGFNSILTAQRDEPGQATVTLYEFNTSVDLAYGGYPIAEAPKSDESNYTPSGRTALHSAIYWAITETVDQFETMLPDEVQDNVITIVLTDRKENVSKTHHEAVREQVKIRQKEDDREFPFIGANQDAALTAEEMTIGKCKSLNWSQNAEGTRSAYESTSERVRKIREIGETDGYTEEDCKRQLEAKDS